MSLIKAFLIPAVCALGLSACDRSNPQDSQSESTVPVELAIAEQRDLPVEIPAVGTVEPIASVQLRAKVGGEVQQVGFADGAYVKRGEVLFEIDPSTYRAAVERAEANLTIAEAQSRNAEDQLKRYTTLSTKGAASEEQYAQFYSTARQQEAEVSARKADVTAARLSLDWATVRSPMDGRAGAALVKPGNIVQAEGEVLTVINQLEPIYAAFAVPEAQLNNIRARQSESPIVVVARDPETHAELQRGTLSFINNNVDTASGMVSMKSTFENSDESLWPGQFVDVVIELRTERNAIVIPSVAILESQAGSRVFVVENGIAHLRDVKVGRTYGGDSVITSGLQPGDSVVSNGQLRLRDGSKVAVPEKANPQP